MSSAAAAEPEAPEWASWPVSQKLRLRMHLRRRRLRERARPDQLPPEGAWRVFFMRGGRGSGKSWAGANALAEEILTDPERTEGTWAIVAPTFADARDKCVESEESGILMALGTSKAEVDANASPLVKTWNRSIGELEFHDGTKIRIDGADDGAPRIQGENLRGVWADEIGLWKRWKMAWHESIMFALRKGRSRIIATGTPKRSQPARALVKELIADSKSDPLVVVRRLRTADNWHNLSQTFRAAVSKYVGTVLGQQELEGIMLEDAEGALWKRAWIDELRLDEDDDFPYGGWQHKPRMGCDLSDGTVDGDEHSYAIAAQGMDHELYVLASEGFRDMTPYAFARECITTADKHGAIIVLEKNHGGQWAVEVFERVMRDLGLHVPLEIVHASQGKRTRAEPVAALYEPRVMPTGKTLPGRVHHAGIFEELEDQMTNWTGTQTDDSPDRMDALVWALWRWIEDSFTAVSDDDVKAVPYEPAAPADPVELMPAMTARRRRDPEVVEGAVQWS